MNSSHSLQTLHIVAYKPCKQFASLGNGRKSFDNFFNPYRKFYYFWSPLDGHINEIYCA